MVMENLDSSRPVRRLGFREIVPGVVDSDQAAEPDVPKYDLGQRIMADQRRVVGATRKRRGQQKEASPVPVTGLPPEDDLCRPPVSGGDSNLRVASETDALLRPAPPAVHRPMASGRIWHPVMTDAQRRVIAQIVTRDIERLCRGERIFGS